MLEETMSNWQCVVELIKQPGSISFNSQLADLFYHDPEQLMCNLSCFKFASKLIGKPKQVLHIGCQEGLGTYILAKECGFACGIDSKEESILTAKNSFNSEMVQYHVQNKSNVSESLWDAVVSLSLHELIKIQEIPNFLCSVEGQLLPHGIAVIGCQNQMDYLDQLEKEMRSSFPFVFLFAAFGEVIQLVTKPTSKASYYLVMGCKK